MTHLLTELNILYALIGGLYVGRVIVALRYVANLAIAGFNLLRATVGQYHPNGDGYVHSWWYCVDCLGNALAGGDPRETISSRAGKARASKVMWGCVLCAFLAWVTRTDHCTLSIEANEGSRAIIPDGE